MLSKLLLKTRHARSRDRGTTPRTALFIAALAASLCLAGCPEDEETWEPIDVSDHSKDKKGNKGSKGHKGNKGSKGGKSASKPKPKPKPKPSRSVSYPTDDAEAALIERSDAKHLEQRARAIHRRLIDALPSSTKRTVESIPLHFDKRRGEVNAFAACTRRSGPLLAVSHGLMQVQAQLARAHATDELFGGDKMELYISLVSSRRSLDPPRDFIPKSQETDAKKRARQAQLLDEGLAFVIGHEIAHHSLSHTGCVGKDAEELTAADLGRLFSRKVRGFNQPNELASDVYGIQNVLAASSKSKPWKEDGALLMLRFFKARTRRSLKDSLKYTFEHTHPHPDVRTPVIKETAMTYRLTGGTRLPTLPNIGFGKR